MGGKYFHMMESQEYTYIFLVNLVISARMNSIKQGSKGRFCNQLSGSIKIAI
jgi:hypothetical protein